MFVYKYTRLPCTIHVPICPHLVVTASRYLLQGTKLSFKLNRDIYLWIRSQDTFGRSRSTM